MPFGKGRLGHTSGVFRHRLDDVRMERHDRRPSAEWVTTRPTVESLFCYTLLPRNIPWGRRLFRSIEHYKKYFS
jgi:hypothetical protein